MNNQIFLYNVERMRPANFSQLREDSRCLYTHDKIYWAWYKGSIALNAYQIAWEIAPIMANTSRNMPNWQFVNISLSVADQKHFGEWFVDNETTILPTLSEINADGYKFSVSYDFDNECFIAALSGNRNTNENNGCTITARSNEWIEAIGLVVYKHVVMCNTGDWQDYAKPANWG